MKWIDYREKLGIGFSDSVKYIALKNSIDTLFSTVISSDRFRYYQANYTAYLLMTGHKFEKFSPKFAVARTMARCRNMLDLISTYIAFCNSCDKEQREMALSMLTELLDNLSIQYDIIRDEDGTFIFPKGAKELDDGLVSQPLEWLNDYPNTQKAFIKALRAYSDATDETASETADQFRKALESFFQEYFSNKQNLEKMNRGNANEKTQKSDYAKYLISKNVPGELANDIANNLQSYTNFMNNYAKHHDKTSKKVLEYFMYQTGNIIRLLITLKHEEAHHAD